MSRVLIAVFLLIFLKRLCIILCVPPREKKEKLKYHIITAETPFEKFCTTKNLIHVDEKDIGTITKEGYYPSCVVALFCAIELALVFGCSLGFAVYSSIFGTGAITLVIAVFKKRILNLSRKILIKQNII